MKNALPVLVSLLLGAFAADAAASNAKEAQRLMKQLARDKDPATRAEAAWELGEMGAWDAVGALAAALRDREPGVRANAAASLWKLTERTEAAAGLQEAVPALRAALQDKDPDVLMNVSGALHALHYEPGELVPVWKLLLGDGKCRNRVSAATSLEGYVSPKELYAVARQCLGDEDFEVADDARGLMGRLKKTNDRELMASLAAEARNSKESDRGQYVRHLESLKSVPAEELPFLVTVLRDAHLKNRAGALSVLSRMGESAREAVPAIAERLLEDGSGEVRVKAARALADLGPVAHQAIPSLIQALKTDDDPDVRKEACYALRAMELLAKAAIPALNEALRDPDAGVRSAARTALMRLDRTR